MKGAGRQLQMPQEEAGMHATERQHYAELDFADRRPVPPPPSDMFVVAYAEVSHAGLALHPKVVQQCKITHSRSSITWHT